ncbi:hypothetical protein MFLO_08997 [Listeria floridensis FSL S10-1187]|uniref:Uncharacterized protein n=1 Tax=Listeria floridensis FSL S10-1187 TaxID=1265817 RepID=A0ABP3AXP6_9LIST|nr:hypothetical protein [Listeria floridensis]EUJ31348.1 hypothetical protein MFLO_08997 [Listeria floridensis FSL S10-1187]
MLFFGLGLTGLLLLLFLLSYFVQLSLRHSVRSIYSWMLLVALCYSFFAGHILFSALSSTFFGLICGGIILKNERRKLI